MPCQLRNCLLVHPLVEHGGDEIVPQGMQMKRRGESQFTENLSQALGKGIGMNWLPLGVGEQVGADLPVVLPGHALLEAVQAVSYTHLDVYKRQSWHRARILYSSRLTAARVILPSRIWEMER